MRTALTLVAGCTVLALLLGSRLANQASKAQTYPSAAGPLVKGEPQQMQNSIGMHLVRVPAGTFMMGLPDEVRTHDPPLGYAPHRVRITRPFYLGVYEVTAEEYRRVMGEPSTPPVAESPGPARMPATNMTWNEAQEFCRRLSDLPQERAAARHYRLPTEAQWEYACRGGSTKPRDGRPTVTGSGANKVVALQPIGSHEPNEFGLHDMRGNAWEWCSDWFHPTYYRRSPELDPQGPASGITRVVRAGATGCLANLSTVCSRAIQCRRRARVRWSAFALSASCR